MTEQLAGWFVNNLGDVLRPEVIVFIVSLLPILELRGGILVGFLLGMDLLPSFIIAFIGNIIPVPFILMFIKFIFKKLKKTRMKGFIEKIENKAMSKSNQIQKYAYLGLFLFVGIPLPGTGAWTGSLIAALLDMDNEEILRNNCSRSNNGRNNYFDIELWSIGFNTLRKGLCLSAFLQNRFAALQVARVSLRGRELLNCEVLTAQDGAVA